MSECIYDYFLSVEKYGIIEQYVKSTERKEYTKSVGEKRWIYS